MFMGPGKPSKWAKKRSPVGVQTPEFDLSKSAPTYFTIRASSKAKCIEDAWQSLYFSVSN